MQPKSLDEIINPDFNPGLTQEQQEHFEKQKADEYALAYAVKRTFSTENGKKTFAWLKKQFDELPTWCSGMENVETAIYHGFVREGQKSVVRQIEYQMEQEEILKKEIK